MALFVLRTAECVATQPLNAGAEAYIIPQRIVAHAVIELEAGAVAKGEPGRDDIADVLLPAWPVLAAIRDEVAGLGVAPGGNELSFHLPVPGCLPAP